MSRRILLALTLLLLAGPTARGGSTEEHAPIGVAAVEADGSSVLVTWSPGAVVADSFRVYGVDAAGATALLLDTAQEGKLSTLGALVRSGFSTYAVSGVLDGRESQPVHDLFSTNGRCIRIQFPPPSVSHEKCPSRGSG